MNKILGLFGQRRTILILVLYLLLSFLFMATNDPFILRGMRIAILQGIGWVSSAKNYIKYRQELEEENKILRKQLLEFSLANQKLQEQLLENLRLRRLLKFKEESNFSYIPATVIGIGQEQTIRSLILNVGSADGVVKNQTVVTEQGLVGKILIVEPHESVTQILMDQNSLVSVRLQKSREIGVIGWTGNLWLDLNYIPRDVVVEPGEVVLTSGLSRLYPRGIKIGIVAEVAEVEYELFKSIKVKPAVNFNNLEEVFILFVQDSLLTGEQSFEQN
jgi:rod shape-determining protein MreC